MTGEPSKVCSVDRELRTRAALSWKVDRAARFCLVQVSGNVKAAVGSVKETVGAAVGAKQMEADGELRCLTAIAKTFGTSFDSAG